MQPRRARVGRAAITVVVIAEGEDVGDAPVEPTEGGRGDPPLGVRAVVGDIATVQQRRDAEPLPLLEDELGLRLEVVRVGARVDLRIGKDDDRPHGARLPPRATTRPPVAGDRLVGRPMVK